MSVQAVPTHLICFSHLRWNFVYQRPQHLLSRAAQNFAVTYFEEPVFEGCDYSRRLRVDHSGVRVLTPILPNGLSPEAVNRALRKELLRLLSETRPARLIAWYYTPMALQFADELAPDLSIYDNMDELSAFDGAPPLIATLESELLSRCDVVFVGGRSLFEAKRRRHHNAHLFPSSVDVQRFAAARGPLADPLDQAALARPRLGFFGVIDERMDLDLVADVASRRPEWQIIMVGPTAKIDPAVLPRAGNIHWLGMKSYAELPHYLAGWDVGFMPFALNEATRFISPTKTPEFLAAGKPVISTPVTDVVDPYGKSGLVDIAANADEVVACAERLLAKPQESWLERVDQKLAQMSWDQTWAAMMERIAIIPSKQQKMALHG